MDFDQLYCMMRIYRQVVIFNNDDRVAESYRKFLIKLYRLLKNSKRIDDDFVFFISFLSIEMCNYNEIVKDSDNKKLLISYPIVEELFLMVKSIAKDIKI